MAGVLDHHPSPREALARLGPPFRGLFADTSEEMRLLPGDLTQLVHRSNTRRSDARAGGGRPLASWTLLSTSWPLGY